MPTKMMFFRVSLHADINRNFNGEYVNGAVLPRGVLDSRGSGRDVITFLESPSKIVLECREKFGASVSITSATDCMLHVFKARTDRWLINWSAVCIYST